MKWCLPNRPWTHLNTINGLRRYQSVKQSDKSAQKLNQSYVHKPGSWPLFGITIGQLMDSAATRFGDREALVSIHQGIRTTFTEAKQDTDKLAAGFLALGLKRGDRIGIWGQNTYQWYVTQYAAAKAGLILVNINPMYRTDELKFCLNKVSIKAIVCDEIFKTSNYYEMLCDLAPEVPNSPKGQMQSKNLPFLKTIIMITDNNN
ncbi:Acyl-CoA synthetase member 2 mitochondrial, partial [Halocaridina rubra]